MLIVPGDYQQRQNEMYFIEDNVNKRGTADCVWGNGEKLDGIYGIV